MQIIQDIKNKFNMTLEQNIFVAKKYVVDYIYKSAKLEGINITFPETQAIVSGASVAGIKVDDIIKINNLKRTWSYLLETLDEFTDFDYLCRLNMIIGGEGSIYGARKPKIYLRMYDVRISGTKWQPSIPIEYDVRNEMMDILSNNNISNTEQSINLMLWAMRRQIFSDGNKRTAMMIANKKMISHGVGVISVPDDKIKPFYELLINFYETNDMEKIKKFVYENCIDGLNI